MWVRNAIGNIRTWSLRNENSNAFIVILSCITGCAAGFGAFLLKWIIKFIADHLQTLTGHSLHWHEADLWLLIMPLAGIMLAVAWQRWVAHANMVHCTSKIVDYLNSKNYSIPGKFIYNPIAACGITLGFGGSAGAEGPIAFAGASIGSRLGKLLGLDDKALRLLVGIGAGAGIAGIFKSPIAGVLFTIEVLRMDMGAAPVTGLIMACVCASVTCYAFTGTQVYMPYTQQAGLGVPIHWVALLGIFCGLYSLLYNWVTIVMRKFFSSRRRPWVSWISGGMIVGIILFMFPAIYGEGYPVMTQLINGDHSGVLASGLLATPEGDTSRFILILTVMLILKSLATVCSNSAGGVAGDFAPTLFVGTLAGTVFSMAAESLFGIHIPVSLCAMFAMSGAFAGIVHAPVMAIFLVTEITGAFNFILPITVCAAASYITVVTLHPAGRYIETHYDDLASLFRKS
ncbi:MAG: chloride channel protein [Bacteroidales bacterium]|nr:chloride channel protein [Bacteroidales bacterium]